MCQMNVNHILQTWYTSLIYDNGYITLACSLCSFVYDIVRNVVLSLATWFGPSPLGKLLP